MKSAGLNVVPDEELTVADYHARTAAVSAKRNFGMRAPSPPPIGRDEPLAKTPDTMKTPIFATRVSCLTRKVQRAFASHKGFALQREPVYMLKFCSISTVKDNVEK